MKGKLFVILILVILGSLVIGDNGEFDYSELHSYLYDITLLAPTDSRFIVGDGTDWVAESGNTARTSLGLGLGDSPTFAQVTATNLAAPTKGTATFVVAPSSASALVKAKADYECDGTADEVQINLAIVAAAAAGGRDSTKVGVGGEVHLLAGYYYIASPILMLDRVDLIGHGNLQSVRIHGGDNCGHGIYFKAWDKDNGNNPLGVVNLRGQFQIKNINIILSLTQSAASWGIYIDNDGTEKTYDNIYENVYCGRAKTGGTYVKKEWASHYNNCTFETGASGSGPGFQTDAADHSVFVACYFRGNVGHGCQLGDTGTDGGSYNYFYGCGFNANGDGSNASSGLIIKSSNWANMVFTSCFFTANYHSGFNLDANCKGIFLTNCVAYNNAQTDGWDRAGFKLGASSAERVFLYGCSSTYQNNGSAACGYYVAGKNISIRNCIADYNHKGVYLNTSSATMGVDIDVIFGANNDADWLHAGGITTSIGKTCQDVFTNVTALSGAGILISVAGTGSAQAITSFDGQMAVPRNVIVTCTNNDTPTGNVLIRGVTADGKVFDSTLSDESIAITPGGTTQGNIAWSVITRITIPAGVEAADSVSVGWGDKLGLSNQIRATGDVYKIIFNNAHDLLTDYTINASYGTVLPDTAIAGAGTDDFVIYYKGF